MIKRAETYDEIKPLIEMCKNGRLFDVQDWIETDNPINSPPPPEKGARKKSPLQIAIDCGFHSLVQVLLEGGAEFQGDRYNGLEHALTQRKLDIIKLLVNHGADIHTVDMTWVFDAWDPKIIEYFIDQGADNS
jgi:ankyrin repeat protein